MCDRVIVLIYLFLICAAKWHRGRSGCCSEGFICVLRINLMRQQQRSREWGICDFCRSLFPKSEDKTYNLRYIILNARYFYRRRNQKLVPYPFCAKHSILREILIRMRCKFVSISIMSIGISIRDENHRLPSIETKANDVSDSI